MTWYYRKIPLSLSQAFEFFRYSKLDLAHDAEPKFRNRLRCAPRRLLLPVLVLPALEMAFVEKSQRWRKRVFRTVGAIPYRGCTVEYRS